MNKFSLFLCAVSFAFLSATTFADDTENSGKGGGKRKEKILERMKNATPEQKEKIKARMEKFKNATPEEREKMKDEMKARMEKFKNATPEELEKMKAEMKGKKGGEKGGAREAIEAFKSLSPAEQLKQMEDPAFWENKPEKIKDRLKELYNKLSKMSPAELESMGKERAGRDDFRKLSPDEKFEKMQSPEFWKSVPEEHSERLKQFYNEWSNATDDEKATIREFHEKVKNMSPQERRKKHEEMKQGKGKRQGKGQGRGQGKRQGKGLEEETPAQPKTSSEITPF